MRKHLGFFLAAAVATTLLTSGAQAQTAPSAGAGAGQGISDEAKQFFNAGVALLQDPEGEKVEEAYRQFRTAYEISGSAKILGNMGFCAMRLERDGEAIDAYSRYLREVPEIDAEERAQIVRDLQTLSVGVTRLELTTNQPSTMIIDERIPVRGARVTNSYGPVNGKIAIGIRPGHHVFTAKVSGHDNSVWEMEAYAGAKDEHAFKLVESAKPMAEGPARESRSNLGPALVLSAGGAMLVAGAITGVIALGKTHDIEDRCPNDTCPRSFNLDSERSSTRTIVAVTDVLFLVGAITTLGGLYWGYRTWSSPEQAKPPPAKGQAKAPSFLSDWNLGVKL